MKGEGRISFSSSMHILNREKDLLEVKVTFLEGFLLQCCITKVSLTANILPACSEARMPTRLGDVGSAEGEHIPLQPRLWLGAEGGENASDFLAWYHWPLMACFSKQPAGKMQQDHVTMVQYQVLCCGTMTWILDQKSEEKKNRVGVLHSGISRGQSAACTVTQQTFPRGTWLSITRPAHPFLANIWVLPVVSSFCSWNSPVCQAPALAPFPQFNLSTHRFLGDDVTYTKQAALCQHLLLHPLWKRNTDAVCSWAVSACLHLVHLESYYFSLFGHPFPKDKQKSSTSERHLSASQSDYPALQELHK